MAHANDINHIQRVGDKSTVVEHSKNCVIEFAFVIIRHSNLLMILKCQLVVLMIKTQQRSSQVSTEEFHHSG